MKNVSRHQHDKNRYSRIATVDSCFVLFETRQHCVAKIYNASQTASAHKLQNDPFTISSSVLWTHLRPETRVATLPVPGRKETKCQCWCLERRKINVAGQSQPKHSNAWPVLWSGLVSRVDASHRLTSSTFPPWTEMPKKNDYYYDSLVLNT